MTIRILTDRRVKPFPPSGETARRLGPTEWNPNQCLGARQKPVGRAGDAVRIDSLLDSHRAGTPRNSIRIFSRCRIKARVV